MMYIHMHNDHVHTHAQQQVVLEMIELREIDTARAMLKQTQVCILGVHECMEGMEAFVYM